MENILIGSTVEGVIVRTFPPEADWFELTDTACAWSGQNGVISVMVIDSEGYAQAMFVGGIQKSFDEAGATLISTR